MDDRSQRNLEGGDVGRFGGRRPFFRGRRKTGEKRKTKRLMAAAIACVVFTLSQLGIPGTPGAFDLEDWLQNSGALVISPFYVGNHDVDLAFPVRTVPWGYPEDTVYTNEVTVKRGDSVIFTAGPFLSGGPHGTEMRYYTAYDEELNKGEEYTYTVIQIIKWIDEENRPQQSELGGTEIHVTTGEAWGYVTRNILWNGGTYSVVDNPGTYPQGKIIIEPGGSLTIGPGTIVEAQHVTGSPELAVKGELRVDGAVFNGCINIETQTGSFFSMQNATPLCLDVKGEHSGVVDIHLSGLELPDQSISIGGAQNLVIENSTLKDIKAWGNPALDGGRIDIKNNRIVSGDIEVRDLGSSDLFLDFNQYEGTLIKGHISLFSFTGEGDMGERSISRNTGFRSIRLGDKSVLESAVSHVNITENEIIDDSNGGFAIDIQNGSSNVVLRNTIIFRGASYNWPGGGVGLGYMSNNPVEGVSNNLIWENTIKNYKIGILLDTAADNRVWENTLEGNSYDIILSGTRDNIVSDNIADNINLGAYALDPPNDVLPEGNAIYNNIFRHGVVGFVSAFTASNTWSQEKAPGPNIVGGPFLGGNYWGEYDGGDTDGDLIGDTPFTPCIYAIRGSYTVCDNLALDHLPLLMPRLTISNGPQNPTDTPIEGTPPGDWQVLVNHLKLSTSDRDVTLTGLSYAIEGEIGQSSITRAFLSRDTDCYGISSTPLAEGVIGGNGRIVFSGLGETIPASDSSCYNLWYVFPNNESTYCIRTGASIGIDDVEAVTTDNSGQPTPAAKIGSQVIGTVIPGDCEHTLAVNVNMSEGGTVTRTPALDIYSHLQQVSLVPQADEGYVFDHWSGVEAAGTGTSLILSMDKDYSVTAHFRPTPPSDGRKHGKTKDPINTATGEFYFEMPLINLGGPLPLACGLYYGSAVSRKRDVGVAFGQVMGPSWLHNYQILRLYKGDQKTDILFYRGKILKFQQQGAEWSLALDEDVEYRLKADDLGYYHLLDPETELVYVFRPDRLLDRIQDRKGNMHSLVYDGSGNLARVEDGLGRELHFTYDGFRLTGVHDGRGRSCIFSYTGNLLTAVTDPTGKTIRFDYDTSGNGLITRIVYPNGNAPYTQTYDDRGRVIAQTDANGKTTALSFDGEAAGRTVLTYPDLTTQEHVHAGQERLTGFQDPSGRQIQFGYDEKGRRNYMKDRMGDEMSMLFDPSTGELSSITGPDGSRLSYVYEPREQSFGDVSFPFSDLIRIDYPDGTSRQFAYDAAGNLTGYTDQAGNRWTYEYNERGQKTRAVNPTGGVENNIFNPDGTLAASADSDSGETTYRYDAYLRLISTTLPSGHTSRIEYDLNGNIVSVTDENGNRTDYEYDANRNMTRMTEGSDRSVFYTYDEMDRFSGISDGVGRSAAVQYDALGRPLATRSPNDVEIRFQYDASGYLGGIQDGEGAFWPIQNDPEGVVSAAGSPSSRELTFEKNRWGLVIGVSDPMGNSVSLFRDVLGRVTEQKDPMGRSTRFNYDPRGLLSEIHLPDGAGLACRRNDLGRIAEVLDFNGNAWRYEYTPMGRLSAIIDPLGNRTGYSYDENGWMSRISYPTGELLDASHDPAGRLVRKIYSDGLDIAYTYDALDRLTGISGVQLSYNSDDQVTNTRDTETGTDFGASYDPDGRLVSVSYNNGLFSVTYTYDGNDMLTAVEDSLTGTRLSFLYDLDGRLTEIRRPSGIHTRYAWDGGNRISRIEETGLSECAFTLNAAGEILQEDCRLPLDPSTILAGEEESFQYDEASQIAGEGYAYDARGRCLLRPGQAFAWDAAGRLISAGPAEIAYNGFGDPVTRSENGSTTRFFHNYALESTPLVAGKNEASGLFIHYFVRDPAGKLLYGIRAEDGSVFFYHFDKIGSTLFLTDAGGLVTDSYAYDPYGKLLVHQGENDQPYTFVGAFGVRQEGTSGLYHMGERFYDSTSGAFLSIDPMWPDLTVPISLNPYAYASGNPVSYMDPEGLSPLQKAKEVLTLRPLTKLIEDRMPSIDPDEGRKELDLLKKTSSTVSAGNKGLGWGSKALIALKAVSGSTKLTGSLTKISNVASKASGPLVIAGGLVDFARASRMAYLIYSKGNSRAYAKMRDELGAQYVRFFWGDWKDQQELNRELRQGVINKAGYKLGELAYDYYGSDLSTVVSGTTAEKVSRHNEYLRSNNPVNVIGVWTGEMGYAVYEYVCGSN